MLPHWEIARRLPPIPPGCPAGADSNMLPSFYVCRPYDCNGVDSADQPRVLTNGGQVAYVDLGSA
jgi:hypothetical protein